MAVREGGEWLVQRLRPAHESPFGSRLLGPADQSARRLRIRVRLLLTVLLVATNLIGAIAVVGLFFLVAPPISFDAASVVAMAVSVPVYVVVSVLVGAVWGTRQSLSALRWAIEDREPDEHERWVALRVPLRLTALEATLWALAVVLFTLLSALIQPALVPTVVITLVIAGAMVTAICHQLTEFALRPVAARALSGDHSLLERAPTAGVRRRIVLYWGLGTAVPVTGLMVAAVLAMTRDDVSRMRLAVIVLVVGAVVLLVGLLISALDARAISNPLTAVRRGMQRVERGDLDVDLQVYDGTELGALVAGFNAMTDGLRERDRMQDLFGRHVGKEVAEAAMKEDVELGGEVRTVSILFVDLIGSTSYAADRPPEEVVEVLNRFCTVVVSEVDGHGGLVNKFMGDAVLAVFGAPVARADHATAALRTARAVAQRLAEEVSEVRAGVGVATGEAVAGNVGDRRRFEYTVIGDAVNQAARLTELAKERDGLVAVSGASLDAADDDERAHWRVEDDEVTLRGRSEPTRVAVLAKADD